MDPDGTNRIVKQQIKEWHAIVDQERNAKLLDGHAGGSRWARLERGRQALLTAIRRRAPPRRKSPVEPVALIVPVSEPLRDLIEP
jgi:hypothetical protein